MQRIFYIYWYIYIYETAGFRFNIKTYHGIRNFVVKIMRSWEGVSWTSMMASLFSNNPHVVHPMCYFFYETYNPLALSTLAGVVVLPVMLFISYTDIGILS